MNNIKSKKLMYRFSLSLFHCGEVGVDPAIPFEMLQEIL